MLLPLAIAGSAIGSIISTKMSDDQKERALNRQLAELQKAKILNADATLADMMAMYNQATVGSDSLSQYSDEPYQDVGGSAERGAQQRALQEMLNLYENEGVSDVDRAMMESLQFDSDLEAKRANDAIITDMRNRGMSGSGQEAALRAMSAQSVANANRNQDAAFGYQAQQRALEALANYGNMASGMQDQNMQLADAMSAIQRGNADLLNNNKYYNSGLDAQKAQDIFNARSTEASQSLAKAGANASAIACSGVGQSNMANLLGNVSAGIAGGAANAYGNNLFANKAGVANTGAAGSGVGFSSPINSNLQTPKLFDSFYGKGY